jgi:trimeric autotransporter adhesin
MKPTLYALAGALAAVLITTTSALAGSGVGATFNLGQTNTVNATSVLSGNPAGNPLLRLIGLGTAATVRAEAGSGIAINGVSSAGTGQFGQSVSGIGLSGLHSGGTGSASGVYGQTNSTDPGSAGVTGRNTAGGPGLQALVTSNSVPPVKVNSTAKVASLNADLLDGLDASALQGWKLGGNAGTTPGTNFVGTTDNNALELKVNSQRALRLEPAVDYSAKPAPNVVGGFAGNSIQQGVFASTIGGGGVLGAPNLIFNTSPNNLAATIAGGAGNHVSATYGTIAGGQLNEVSGSSASVAGGVWNIGSGGAAAVAGGVQNTASAEQSAVGGGLHNVASGTYSVVSGGENNTASGTDSVVVGGAAGTASGLQSIVVGGLSNSAFAYDSFAAGTQAKATKLGSFVWGDATSTDVTSPADNSFTVRASGGMWLGTNSSPSITAGHFIDTSTGAYLTSTGVWTDSSDRALKHDFRALDKRSVLEKVARMPITSWSYKAEQPSVRHIGPMAQDFYAAFGLGLDNKHIATIDEGGVALAAIQGLYRQNKALLRENRTLRAQLSAQNARLAKLEHAFATLTR